MKLIGKKQNKMIVLKIARLKSKGFTLVELMITVAIVAILAAIAIPGYQRFTEKARRSDGTSELTQIMNMQERFYINNFPPTYTTDLTQLGFSVSNNRASAEGYYTISAAACGAGIQFCVQLTATALSVQDGDGDLTLDSLGQKARINAIDGGNPSDWD